MTALVSNCGIVPSIAIVSAAIGPYMGSLRYDALAGDTPNMSAQLRVTAQRVLLKERVKT